MLVIYVYIARFITIAVGFAIGGWALGLALLAVLVVREVFGLLVFDDLEPRDVTATIGWLAVVVLALEVLAYVAAFAYFGAP